MTAPFVPPKRANTGHLFQLLGRWNGKALEQPMAFEQKMNGWRAGRWRGVDGKPRLWTRNGHEIHGTAHIQRALAGIEAIAGQRLFFDGEFVVTPTDGNDTLLATKTWCETSWKAGGNAGTLHLFDIMPEDDWKRGGSDMPWMQRKAWLCDLVNQWQDQEADRWEWIEGSRGAEGPTPIRAIPHRIVRSAGEVRRLVADIWARGGEGAVLKALDAGYQRNRVSTQMKVKRNGER